MDMRKRMVTLIGLVVVLGGGYGIYASQNKDTGSNTPAVTTASPSTSPATLVSYPGQEGKTALELLKSSHTVETKQYSFGEMVQSIDGLAADSGHYWGFYVGGTAAAEGADAYKTKTGDAIEWRYEVIK